MKELKSSPKIRALREGDWTDYDDVDRLTVRRGSRREPEDIALRLAEWAHEELTVLKDAGTPAAPERRFLTPATAHTALAPTPLR
ncbi:hypothetical protein [Streptomyces pseudovenezuelae]|uniref:Uncharacterized protein n=1 Tax=Streptomyces pseudovenezuelae TaxID=67350 RepID=A0ABT6M177_9ACTN|nr:hypothetical protein [Streptomyces pseudovenezuelae]MDH6222268.1 hypothetical protein [Streptomyces pseudovenezuelae]